MKRLDLKEWTTTASRILAYCLIIVFAGLILILGPVSCCPEYEDVFPPEGTLRYWDDHDTIVFYSPELNIFETYPVCSRDYIGAVDELHDRCNSYIQLYAAKYRIKKGNCDNNEFFVFLAAPGEITVMRGYSDKTVDNAHIITANANRDTLEISGRIYKDVYQIEYNSPFDSLSTVFFTQEHGIIQYEFNSISFRLVNEEI